MFKRACSRAPGTSFLHPLAGKCYGESLNVNWFKAMTYAEKDLNNSAGVD